MAIEWNDAPPRMPRLAPGQVDVWSVKLNPAPEQVEGLAAALSSDEHERAGRFHFERDQRRYRCARGALRFLLAPYLDVDPEDVAFGYGPHGKPMLSAPFAGQLTFNVSHSGELALIAIGKDLDIGVDVEVVRPMEDADGIASRFFAPKEAERLRALPSRWRTRAFFACWTRKEAYLKALGSGLAKPLDAFEVTFAPGEAAGLVVYGNEAETARWRVCDVSPDVGYAGALVTDGAVTVAGWRFAADRAGTRPKHPTTVEVV